ncbi:MAG: PRC-barrel domain-containing protein [Chitinophagaceae bacterium]
MKRTIKNLMGFAMGATDGEIGKVKDFYFDDVTWTIRYLVVETGNWLSNRKVLISSEAFLQCDWANETLPVNLTKEQIKKSPDIDTDQPVSRQHEMELYAHYSWTNYWGGGIWAGGMGTTGMMMPMSSVPMEEAVKNSKNTPDAEADGDPHLRSAKNVQGYTIHALDDTIGDVEDFIVDDSNWTIHYMVVDTGKWFPGKKVTISPDWIKEINWETSEVIVNASVDQVKNSPEYGVSKHLSTEYEANLQNYYGRFISHK